MTEISRTGNVLSFADNGFSHTVDVLFTFMFALSDVDTRYYFLPACLDFQFCLFLS